MGVGAKFVAAMDDGDGFTDAAKIEGVPHGGVAAAVYGYVLVFEEVAVAGGAVGDTFADEGLFVF